MARKNAPVDDDPDAAAAIRRAAQAARDVILEYVAGGGMVLPGEPVPWTRDRARLRLATP
jgi:hypothetical protein